MDDHDLSHRTAQVFSPYGSRYVLPIPASATPKATTTALNVNFTEATMGGIMDLANSTTNFALRFTGTHIPALAVGTLSACLVAVGPPADAQRTIMLALAHLLSFSDCLPVVSACCLCSTL